VEVSKALDPAQQVVKIVHAELIGLLGSVEMQWHSRSDCDLVCR
jgi:signal recognition particle GTPase